MPTKTPELCPVCKLGKQDCRICYTKIIEGLEQELALVEESRRVHIEDKNKYKNKLAYTRANPCNKCQFRDNNRHEPCYPCVMDKRKDSEIFKLQAQKAGLEDKLAEANKKYHDVEDILDKKDDEIAALKNLMSIQTQNISDKTAENFKLENDLADAKKKRNDDVAREIKIVNDLMREKYMICAALWARSHPDIGNKPVLPYIVDEILRLKKQEKQLAESKKMPNFRYGSPCWKCLVKHDLLKEKIKELEKQLGARDQTIEERDKTIRTYSTWISHYIEELDDGTLNPEYYLPEILRRIKEVLKDDAA